MAAATPDLRWAACAQAGSLHLADLVNGTTEVLREEEGLDITRLDIHWSGRAVVIGQRHGPPLLLDLDEGDAKSAFSRFSMDDFAELGHNTPVAFAPAGYRLAVSAADNQRFSLGNGVTTQRVETSASGYLAYVTVWSPSGNRLLPSGCHRSVFDVGGEPVGGAVLSPAYHIRGATFTPDEQQLITYSHGDQHVRWHDVQTGAATRTQRLTVAAQFMAADRESGLLAFADDGWIELRDLQWEPARAKFHAGGHIRHLTLSEDGHRLLVATDQNIQVWALQPSQVAS